MLSKKANLLETIRGGNPDRLVNQYEALALIYGTPYGEKYPMAVPGGPHVVNGWGVTISFPEGMPGAFPVHDEEHVVCKDITRWRDYVKAPDIKFSPEEWAPYIAEAEKIDRDEYFATAFVAPGIFEQCHYLLEIQNCLIQFYEEPDYMHELIEYITDWELAWAAEICKYLKPDALFHHDDWGSGSSSFISPAMFKEFYEEPYKKVYGFYRDHGVDLIVHHSDSYAANLVPSMIEMGVDIWQGVMDSNNIPEMLEKHGGKLTYMGGIDSGVVDRIDWTQEKIDATVEAAIRKNGKKYYIPCNTMGGPETIYPGAYEAISAAIEKANAKLF